MLKEEASIDTLFHVTSATVAIKILEQGSFLLALSETNPSESFISWLNKNGVREKIKRNIPKLFYLSFARTPASGYIADRASGLTSVKEPVMFVVNGKRLKDLNRNSTFVPQDYWHNSDENGRQLGAAREAEERFYSSNPRAKLGSSLIEIRIIADTHENAKTHAYLRKLIILCKKKSILLKLFSKDNKAGFIRGIENVQDRAKALSFILSKTDKNKPWPQYDRGPSRDLLFLKDLLEKNSYEELSSKDRNSLYYYLSGAEIYGDLAKHFSSTIHNIRGGRDSDKEFLYDLLKKNNITNLSKMFIMLQAKWTRLRDEYNAEEDRKWSLKNEEASIEEALIRPQFPKITGHSDNWGNTLTIWMAEKGFKKLGMGAYGHVFKHPNLNYVLKVYIDDGYDKWINICQKLKGNPYVPVFRGKSFKVGPFSVIRMENLKPLEDENNYDLSKNIESYLRGVVSNNKFKKISKESFPNEKSWEDYFGKDHILFTDKKLIQVTDKLIKFFDKNPKYKVDLFHSNFMERDGKLVIIDPIAYSSYPAKALTITEDHYSKKTEKASVEEALLKPDLPKITTKSWRRALTKWASEKGFKAIGQGAYGKVFYSIKRPDIVIKVFSDRSYRFWYKITEQNKGNESIPKFIGSPVKITDGLWAVRMEKLEPLTHSQKNDCIDIGSYARFHARKNYGIPTALNFEHINYAKIDQIRKTVVTDDMESIITDLLFALSKGENSLKYMLDLHIGNFMRRGNTIVLVDPLQPINENLRSLFRINKPSTTEDAMDNNFSKIDVLSYVPIEKIDVVEEAAVIEEADKSVNNRKTFMTMPGVKRVLIGPKNGPLIPVMFSSEARMFFPVFKD